MTMSPDTSPAAQRAQFAELRRIGPEMRIEIASAMSDDARAISEAGIRHRHPEWSDDQVRQGLHELLLGRDLARRVRDSRQVRA